MSDALSYSVELAAERSSERYWLEKRLQKYAWSYDSLENRLKKLGLKGFPSDALVDSLASLKHDACSILDALIESGYKYHNDDRLIDDASLSSALYLLDAERTIPNDYLKVFRELKEKMNYKTVNVANDQLCQVDNVYKISRFGGSDVCKIIDVMAEVGYKLGDFHGKKWLRYCDVELIDKLAEFNIDEFLKVFHKLKEKLKYKSIGHSVGQINNILQISQILGYSKAIDTLAEWRNLDVDAYGKDHSLYAGGPRVDEKKVDKLPPWGVIDISHDFKRYKIDSKKGITDKDVQILRYISEQLWRKSLEDLTTCLYKNMPGELIRYFQHLSVEDKKAVIKSIFNCDKTSNHAVTTWLDENYLELVREVGLSLV